MWSLLLKRKESMCASYLQTFVLYNKAESLPKGRGGFQGFCSKSPHKYKGPQNKVAQRSCHSIWAFAIHLQPTSNKNCFPSMCCLLCFRENYWVCHLGKPYLLPENTWKCLKAQCVTYDIWHNTSLCSWNHSQLASSAWMLHISCCKGSDILLNGIQSRWHSGYTWHIDCLD
jgi:hypothetical protein